MLRLPPSPLLSLPRPAQDGGALYTYSHSMVRIEDRAVLSNNNAKKVRLGGAGHAGGPRPRAGRALRLRLARYCAQALPASGRNGCTMPPARTAQGRHGGVVRRNGRMHSVDFLARLPSRAQDGGGITMDEHSHLELDGALIRHNRAGRVGHATRTPRHALPRPALRARTRALPHAE